MDIRVLVVPADEEQAPFVKELKDYDYRKGQEIVGGLIQPVDIDAQDCTVWCNEEGHPLGLPLNRRATAYLYAFAPEHRGFNVLMGDCYISGLPDDDGDTTSVPELVVGTILG